MLYFICVIFFDSYDHYFNLFGAEPPWIFRLRHASLCIPLGMAEFKKDEYDFDSSDEEVGVGSF